MKKTIASMVHILFTTLLFNSMQFCHAGPSDAPLEWKHAVSSALTYPYQIIATFTDNGDGTITLSTGGSVSDAVYAAGWNGVTDIAPSKNAVYDKIETLAGGHDAVTLGADADVLLGLSGQVLGFDTQIANYVFAGPATGVPADPTFRALVANDIPSLSAVYLPLHSKADTAGAADTAVALATTRAINGTNFDGTAAITVPVNNANDATTNATMYPLWTATQGGNYAAKTSVGLTYNPSTGVLTAAGFSGSLTGNVTGNASGSSGSCTGNSATVTGFSPAGSKVLTLSKTMTLTSAGDSGVITLPNATATLPATSDNLSVFAATTSAQLAGVLNDETGSGVAVFGTSPTIATPILTLQDGNGAAPTVDGQVKYDRTTETFQVGDGATTSNYPRTWSKSFVITNPTASADGPVWRVPRACTITAVHLLCKGNVLVGHITEEDANGLNDAGVDGATDITGVVDTNVNDDGSLSNPTIDANDYIGWRTTSVTGTPTKVIVTFEGYWN